MTKQEILDRFNDIDFVYNDSSKHETLSRMLDELLKEQPQIVPCGNCIHWKRREFSSCGYCEERDGFYNSDWFCADGERRSEDA